MKERCGQMFLIGGKDLNCTLELGHKGTCKVVRGTKAKHADTTKPKVCSGCHQDPCRGTTQTCVMGPGKAKGGAWRRATAIPTTVRGRKFPSKIQAATFDWLADQAEIEKTAGVETIIMHEVPIELPALDVNDKPVQKWRVDFYVLRTDGGGQWRVSIYESKGGASAESADFRIKLRAYYRTYPWPVYICRRSGKKIKVTNGMDLIGRSAR